VRSIELTEGFVNFQHTENGALVILVIHGEAFAFSPDEAARIACGLQETVHEARYASGEYPSRVGTETESYD